MKYISVAYDSSKELLDICNQIIGFDQEKHGINHIFSNKFSLKNICESIINLNRSAACINNTKLELNIDLRIPDILIGDDYRLKKILINLIGNAIKFTKNGTVSLNVDFVKIINDKLEIKFHVVDNGIGIKEDYIDKIFDKFYQIKNGDEKFKGNGLGLASVKNMLNEIGSTIIVNSCYGRGSIFSFIVCLSL